MILQSRINVALIGLALSLAFFAATAAQTIISTLQDGISQSKGMRLVQENACSTTADGAHFVGCSSIL